MGKTKSSSVARQIADAIKVCRKPSLPWCDGVLPEGDVGLEIEDYGPVKLPMRPADVRKLQGVVSQAPYGKGVDTLIDKSVRDTLEVDGGRVRFNVEFSEALQLAHEEIAGRLHLDPEHLKAELYKLLIYPKGGFFLPHRDSEKRRGMVATMVVVLPSRFGGGNLIINHGGRRESFSFDDARSQKQPQYLAFYADCEHEVKRVTLGVRVCLAFNLILSPKKKSRESISDSTVDPALQNQIAGWIQNRPFDPLVFTLEHQYTKAGLMPSRLKGADKELHRHVAAIAQSLNCRLFFGQVERHLCQFADDGSFGYGRRGYHRWSGDYDELDIGEAHEDEITIDGWRKADGKRVNLASLACENSQLVSLIPVEDWIPTRQEYEGYTGNAGNTLDRWYRKSVIAIWPKTQHFEILAQMGVPFAVAKLLEMRAQLKKCGDEELEQAFDDCRLLAEAIISHWPSRIHDRGNRGCNQFPESKQFLSELALFEAPELIDKLLQTVARRDWLTDLDQFVISCLRRMDAESILPLLQNLIQFEPPPNQYGIRFLQGLALRDAKWLYKLANVKKRGGLSVIELQGLLKSAVEKLSAHAQRREHGARSRIEKPDEAWLVLCKALIAVQDEQLQAMLQLARDYPTVFDFRTFQVPSAVELRKIAMNVHGELPEALKIWIAELRSTLTTATARPPQPSADYQRDSNTDCNCKFCRELCDFLDNPRLAQTRIAAPQRYREHLERVIAQQGLDVSTTLIRTGSPYSLGFTKTTASHQANVTSYLADLKLLDRLQKPRKQY